jgi:hypothetical protein
MYIAADRDLRAVSGADINCYVEAVVAHGTA